MPPMQVRIDWELEKMIRRAIAENGRSVQEEVNRALRIYYGTTKRISEKT